LFTISVWMFTASVGFGLREIDLGGYDLEACLTELADHGFISGLSELFGN